MHDQAAAVGADANVAGETDRFLKSGIGSAIELVLALDALRLVRRVGRHHGHRRSGRIVVIEELRLELREAELTAGVRVVRDEYPHLLVGKEREVGVEPLRVAAMPDNAQAVARLLVES